MSNITWPDKVNGDYVNASDMNMVKTAVNSKADSTSLTKAGVGLANVDNTSDINKPVSTLQQAAIDNVTAGVGSAITTTTPAGNINTYNLDGGAGTYTNFLTAASTPLVLTSSDILAGTWQAVKPTGATYWIKKAPQFTFAKTVSYTTSIPFYNPLSIIDQVTMSADIVFTPNITASRAGYGSILRVVGDGVHDIDFSAFVKISTSDEFTNVAGTIYQIVFFFDGYDYSYSLSILEGAIPPVALSALTFQSSQTGVSIITNGVQGANGGAFDYLNKGVDAKFLHSGVDGFVQFKYTDTGVRGGILGFNTANAQVAYTSLPVGIFITASNNNVVVINAGVTTDTGVVSILNNWYRVYRVGTTLRVATSANEYNGFTDIATFTLSTANALYPVCVLSLSNKLMFPEGYNVTV